MEGVEEVKEIENSRVKWDKKEREMAGDMLCFLLFTPTMSCHNFPFLN